MITTYVQHRIANRHGDCAICNQGYNPGDRIYWHGYGVQRGETRASHEGCFWPSSNGSGPHLTYGQLTAMRNAVVGHDLSGDQNITKFLGAVRLALNTRRQTLRNGDGDAGLRLGPDLLDGYFKVLNKAGLIGSCFWQLKEANGSTSWTDPRDARPAERPRMTSGEWTVLYRQKMADRFAGLPGSARIPAH